jgi:tRNA dimethylallyltransferase
MGPVPSNTVLVVAGPTASGKSDLAVDVAEEFGGVVINADSMQIYEGLDIVTAAPGPAARKRAPHKLYGIRDPAMPCSAGDWLALAEREIRLAHEEALLPIIVGGTGMYLRTLMTGIAQMPPVDSDIRENVRSRMVRDGSIALHAELAKIDPKSAARINASDSQRIARAVEIYEATGKTLTEWQTGGAEAAGGTAYTFKTVLLEPPRELLYASCNARFEKMLASGALEEIRALASRNLDPALPAMKALGIPNLLRHLVGDMSLEEACKASQQVTRNYVKRQGTWFRNQFVADLSIDAQYSDNNWDITFSFVSKFMLT